MTIQVGKNASPIGVPPAVLLINPKYPRNVGACIRALSCYGVKQLWYTGNRFKLDESERIPREERMKGYAEVDLIQYDYPFDQFPKGTVPIAIEVKPGSIQLPDFQHPENALYVFGPEDGGLEGKHLAFCHHIVSIPTRHCLNLSAAVYTVLYDRQCKLSPQARLDDLLVGENRGLKLPAEFGNEEG